MNQTFRVVLIAAAFSLVANSAQAQSRSDKGFYWGLSAGESHANFEGSAFAIPGTTMTKDTTHGSYKGFAGYRFHPNFALEGGYAYMGKFGASYSTTGGSGQSNIETYGWFVDAVAIWPISNWDLFAKAGAINAEVKRSGSGTGTLTSLNGPSTTEKETNLKWGVGVEYHVTKGVGVRAEFEQVNSVGDASTTGQGDINMLTLGMTFRF